MNAVISIGIGAATIILTVLIFAALGWVTPGRERRNFIEHAAAGFLVVCVVVAVLLVFLIVGELTIDVARNLAPR